VDSTGWVLDVYAHPRAGIVLWLLADDGRRLRLRQRFPVTFYAAGAKERLRALWHHLQHQPVEVALRRTERRDLFAGPTTVLAAQVENPVDLPPLFRKAARLFPDLAFYDADLHLTLRYSAACGVFPLARCRVRADDDQLKEITILDSPWDLDPEPPPLRVMTLLPETDPFHDEPKRVLVRAGRDRFWHYFEPGKPSLLSLRGDLNRYDPDLILTAWGDTWLLPKLTKMAEWERILLPLNRDPECKIASRPERSYFAYGQVIYRGGQQHLFGRWHIDSRNAVMYHDYGMDGIFELARLTALPVQTVARVSPGTGISSMQIVTALRQEIMVPWRKQQAERPKSARELLQADMGGLIFQPLTGLHRDVAEVDFVSMYPSIMERFNISPETIGTAKPTAALVPALEAAADRDRPGLVPQTLKPLLKKRIALKAALVTMPGWHPNYKRYKACASAHKWLLVTCFGYLGYKNARFGRIEAHEAVTAYSREALLRAKEAAEEQGFTVLHLYVDGLWVKKEGCRTVQDFQPLLNEILDRTGLPIALDGIYRWVAFLPSRANKDISVANRYFGVFQSGEIKVRGIEARRHDTPAFISEMQNELLGILAKAASAERLPDRLPELRAGVRRRLADLRAGRVPLEKLVVQLTVSRELNEYRVPSPAALALMQLRANGKSLRPGQHIRILYTLGKPGVHAWDAPGPPDPRTVDLACYRKLALRAAWTILEPLIHDRGVFNEWFTENARTVPLIPDPSQVVASGM
jgi:DNA polymerase-2